MDFYNHGTVEVEVGNMALGSYYSSTGGGGTGSYSAPNGTLIFQGIQDLAASSSIDAFEVRFEGTYATVAGSYRADTATVISTSYVYFTGTIDNIGALTVTGTGGGQVDFSPSAGPTTLELASLYYVGVGLGGAANFNVNGQFTWIWGRLYGQPFL